MVDEITIIHDWDMDRYVRNGREALKRGLDLWKYAINRKLNSFPVAQWLYNEKMFAALAIAELDRLLNLKAIWGLTSEVNKRYPLLKPILQGLDVDVREHYHIIENGEKEPRWFPALSMDTFDKLYDSHYPDVDLEAKYPVWHIDYFNSNSAWLKYLCYLSHLKDSGVIRI